MLSFQLLREAERELELARRWYDEQRHGLGLVFFDAYEDAVQRAQEFPDAGTVVLESTATLRKFPLEGFPFHIAGPAWENGLTFLTSMSICGEVIALSIRQGALLAHRAQGERRISRY